MSSSAAAAADLQPLVLSEVRQAVAVLTLNHPAKRNVLSAEMLAALQAACDAAAADAAVRAVVLAHRGPVFSSGHDIRALVGAPKATVDALFKQSSRLMESLRALPKPVIAQVAGLASAAGLQLAASCDLIVAGAEASFQTPGVQIGLFCSTPMVPVSRAMPSKKVMEMLFTGRAIGAQDAERFGMVNRIVPAARLEAETHALAQEILQYSSYTLAVGKTAFYKQVGLPEHDAYQIACEAMVRNALADAAQEGMSAFVEKRRPHFRD
jgi:enoyl-CoA hydratase/carnithine racemase